MPWTLTLLVTVLILALSAFFVVVEFSLMAARGHRLEERAPESVAVRSALRAQNELTVMLAGAQLGITACTFALGAVTEPALHHALQPLLATLGLPAVVADGAAFVLALVVVTFLHLVVGEMTPKSWAIANPERAATVIALPATGWVQLFRPLLNWINRVANRLVARTGVEPVDRAAAGGHDPETLRALVEHSTHTGTLDRDAASQIQTLIRFGSDTVGELVAGRATPPTAVPHDATVAAVQRAADRSGHFRILLRPAPGADARTRLGVVHLRDTLVAPPDTPAARVARDALHLPASTTLHTALERMRAASEQLAVVVPDEGAPRILGVLTATDFLQRLWPSAGRPGRAPGADR
ncbi:CNNM domain-containing protein [uncultured Tessaracoccus sp.]|uniref:CNNM domain-containing protein n=1 Tax=uncultured Tessaracoccus sp. TaxID=905023 RepID=UPI0025E07430|nr:hemolysin family protein [uncultured Tessaracoccus sp.]